MASTEVYEVHRSHLRLSSCPPRGPGGHGPRPRLPAALAETGGRGRPWPPVGRRPPALPLAAAATRGGALVAGRIGVAGRQADGALRAQRDRAGWAAVGVRRGWRAWGAGSVVKLTLKTKKNPKTTKSNPTCACLKEPVRCGTGAWWRLPCPEGHFNICEAVCGMAASWGEAFEYSGAVQPVCKACLGGFFLFKNILSF